MQFEQEERVTFSTFISFVSEVRQMRLSLKAVSLLSAVLVHADSRSVQLKLDVSLSCIVTLCRLLQSSLAWPGAISCGVKLLLFSTDNALLVNCLVTEQLPKEKMMKKNSRRVIFFFRFLGVRVSYRQFFHYICNKKEKNVNLTARWQWVGNIG